MHQVCHLVEALLPDVDESHAAYDRDEWGDLASFREEASAS